VSQGAPRHRDPLTGSGAPLLALRQVSVAFGGLRAVDDVSLEVHEDEVLGLIGPNGAGKTTLFNLVTRLVRPDAGSITFDGQDLLVRAPHEVIGLGLSRTFQNLMLLGELTVLDNVMVGLHTRMRAGLLACALDLARARQEDAEMRARALEALELVGLRASADAVAGALPFGRQRMVELARAVVSRPRLVLLDEPGAGLNSKELDTLIDVTRRVHGELGITVLLIGHTMRLVLGLSHRVVVLDRGRTIATGTPAEIRAHPAVIEAYLGQRTARAPA
jgi:branched-chain amino acid transport system ATP-binding protein